MWGSCVSGRTVVIYSDLKDPIALQALSLPQLDISCVHVDQMIPLLTRRDWPEVLELVPTVEVDEMFEGAWIINRAFILTGTKLLSRLHERGVDERWFHIRLQKILSLGGAVSYDTGVRGVSRSLLPLNAQWFEMKRSLPDLATPAFEYGFAYERPDISKLSNPLQKSVWSLFDWKVERQMSPIEERRHQFFVEAPVGVPLIACFAGSAMEIFWPRGCVAVDNGEVGAVIEAARSVFRAEAGEVLLYAEGSGLRFYAFSPHLLTVADEPGFKTMVSEWLALGNSANSRSHTDAAHWVDH